MKNWLNQFIRLLMPVIALALLLPLAGCAAAPEFNSLSVFIYAADTIAKLGVFVLVLAVLSGLGIVVVWIFSAIMLECSRGQGDDALRKKRARYTKMLIASGLVFGFLSVLMPSRNVLYAMAASQVGEMVMKNEAVQGLASDAAKALQSWIAKQVTEE